ncbi:hypothetical protein DOTSEDRAFT_25849 [Dothistroma septosporum NZE10]|uniref:Uncharacterized protein n=1 Tax=Dothistroma septosporum (strain NZE10 / CBS 128990) TaxID=675120 RepID=N1PJD7_DOTSN|nr:hypothetical protein DOTSEDRAFT_25849 [Dothistroma septosporum NZE10]
MVLLTVTPAAQAAFAEYNRLVAGDGTSNYVPRAEASDNAEVGGPIQHQKLVEISIFLAQRHHESADAAKPWRLDTLLKGASIYQPPPAPKAEHTPQYKALMQRLREQEEQRQYERMVSSPPAAETFSQRFPNAGASFGPGIAIGHNAADDIDDVTYAEVNRQMILIINVLISIVCTSIAVWMAARRWSVPERLGLSFSSSTVVAVAEVAIYMGYIRRIKDAKTKERSLPEKKVITDTWIIDGKSTSQQATTNESTRYRKGKHR